MKNPNQSQITQLQRSNHRLTIALVGMSALAVGILLGGMNRPSKDDIAAYAATDETLYRIYESGRIEYLRLDEDPPRTAHGVFDWGVVKIDKNYTLRDRP